MCGINGFIHKNPNDKEKNFNLIKKMNARIVHRGPDSEGVYSDEFTALGMQRLSIIDLKCGDQPIYNEDNTKLIVFNGEIYNFKELRIDLLAKGHILRTESDTEVILHLYEQYGADCLNKLNGMFAFCIYDFVRKELFIGRDRAGEKPLYYYKTNDMFIFASELKSIIKTFDIKKEINVNALNMYFSLTYIPAPLTIFEGIYKLPAASYIIYKDGEIKVEKYWDIEDHKEPIYDYEECKRQLREKLFCSVEKKLISDVPLGAFLSGGIDSSIIVGIMSRIMSKPVETFNIGFKLKDFDESGKAKIAADRNKTNHHVHYLDFDDALDELDTILGTFDEPFADSSAIPTYFVSKFARKHVTVVLTGDAGDELFAGYSKYMINYYSDIYNRIPGFLRKNILEKIIYALPDRTSVTRKLRKVVENSSKDVFDKRAGLMMLGMKDDSRNSLLGDGFRGSTVSDFIRQYYEKNKEFDELTKTLYTDLKVVLEGDMLVKVDRMSMLNSLETRVPLLDKDVVELAYRIPSEYKLKGKDQKFILKDAFKDLIPPELLTKGKQGFMVPIGEWFKGPLKHEMLEVLTGDAVREQGIFDHNFILRLIEDHLKERSNNVSALWSLYVFQKWYRKYFI